MNIYAIGLNYADHIVEFKGKRPEAPVFFMKSSTAYLPDEKPFFLPDFSSEIDYETELVLRIGKLGKHIQAKFAHRYIEAYTLGIDFTARDIQRNCRANNLPWEISKAFDGSAPVGKFLPYKPEIDLQNLHFHLDINGKTVQTGHTAQMIFTTSEIIAHLSQYFTLQDGDLIFTGTPVGVGPVHMNEHLEGFLEGEKILNFWVK